MSDDILIHFSSNSSNPSDPTKMAKLEARMKIKGSLSASAPSPASVSSGPAAKFDDATEILTGLASPSDSDDDEVRGSAEVRSAEVPESDIVQACRRVSAPVN